MTSSTTNSSADKASNTKAKSITQEPVGESFDEAFEHIKGAANSVKQAAAALSKDSLDATNEKYLQGKAAAVKASEKGSSLIKERPYTSIGIAFAAGALLTGLLKK